MSVTITFSTTNGGLAISSAIDHGDKENGQDSTAQEIFVEHDGVNEITNCGFFIREVSGTYDGSFTTEGDFNEVISWGDGATAGDFGGFMFNLNALGSYPSSSWPVVSDKSVESAGETLGFVCRTGTGDSSNNAVSIPTTTGCSATGKIQAGSAPNVRFKCRFSIPQSEDTVGIREIEQVLRYDYTS